MSYSYKEFKEDSRRRAFEEKSRYYTRVLEVVETYINPEDIKIFYPRNILNSNEHKEFILFFNDKISIVHFEKEKAYFIRTFDLEVRESTLSIPEYTADGVTMNLVFENGEKLTFNSVEDSNRSWNDTYIDLIQEIFKKFN